MRLAPGGSMPPWAPRRPGSPPGTGDRCGIGRATESTQRSFLLFGDKPRCFLGAGTSHLACSPPAGVSAMRLSVSPFNLVKDRS
eukprot:217601-Pyramimonas_sp.AAC.1